MAVDGSGLLHFIRARREPLSDNGDGVRLVYRSEVIRQGSAHRLDDYFAEKVPLFYRDVEAIISDLRDGYFLTAFRQTLARLPTSETFQQSHFGEIVAGVFAEEVLGLRRIYSKLSLLTAENANAYKMDLVMYDSGSDPLELVFAEVKSSPKCADDGLPARHDGTCFSELFRAWNRYEHGDLQFDLTAARDRLSQVPTEDRERVCAALKPYSGTRVRYAGFAVIDTSTFDASEARSLRTRANAKGFEVDLICIESFGSVALSVFSTLSAEGTN